LKRLLIYCFYDKNGIVDNYVSYFLNKIRKFCYEICVVVNGKITDTSEECLGKYADKIIKKENKGYDSGAFRHAVYSYGFDYLKQYDEVIFANDTFYGPLFNLEQLFTEMELKQDNDFWGITKHPSIDIKVAGVQINEHLQSYFLVYKNNILSSLDFKEYWDKMKTPTNYEEAVAFYELYTTAFFINKGYKPGSLINIKANFHQENRPYFYDVIKWIKKEHVPFIKKKIFELDTKYLKHEINGGIFKLFETIKTQTNYDTDLIIKNVQRVYQKELNQRTLILIFIEYIYIHIKKAVQPWKNRHYNAKIRKIKNKLNLITILKEQN